MCYDKRQIIAWQNIVCMKLNLKQKFPILWLKDSFAWVILKVNMKVIGKVKRMKTSNN